MSSIVLDKLDSYVNIGTAVAWRETLVNHTTSLWIKTCTTAPSCLVSLANATHEVFAIDMNVAMPNTAMGGADTGDALESSGLHPLSSPTAAAQTLSSGSASNSPKNAVREADVIRGGLRVRLEDVNGAVIEAWSEVPILADNRWHLIEVVVHGGFDVSFRVDGRFLNSRYTRRERVSDFTSRGIIEKPLYPACDLIGARNHQRHLCDYFCGRIADIFVSRGGLDGPKLHWWITDMTQGRTVWDRGEFSQQPPGMHLHCCNSDWDSHDYPPASLHMDGFGNNFAVVRDLHHVALKALLKPESVTDSVPSTPGSFQHTALTPQSTPTPTSSATPKAGNSRTPTHSSMNSRSLEKVRGVVSTRVAFTIWIRTLARVPAIVVSIPSSDPIHLVLNYDGRVPSVALVVGSSSFVSFSDVCDGAWRQLEWVIDPLSGCSLFIDGHLSTWEPMTLEEMRAGVQRKRKASTAVADEHSDAGFAAFVDDANPSNKVSFAVADEKKSGGGPAPSGNSSDSDDSSASVVVVDDSTQHHHHHQQLQQSSSSAAHEGLPVFTALNFTAFDENSREPAAIVVPLGGSAGPAPTQASQAQSPHAQHDGAFVLGFIAEQLKELQSSVRGSSGMETSQRSNETSLLHPARLAAPQAAQRSDEPVHNERRRSSARDAENADRMPCVTVGRFFRGGVREFTLTLGASDFYWPLSDGSGRSLRSRLRPAMLRLPMSEDGDLLRTAAAEALKPPASAELEVVGRFVLWPKTVWPSSCIDFYRGQACDLGVVSLPHLSRSGIEVSCFARLYKNDTERHYGHLVEIDRVVVIECARDCIIVTVPGVDEASGAAVLRPFVCASLVLEDAKWHLIRVSLDGPFGRPDAVRLSVDETPVELTPAEIRDDVAAAAAAGSATKSAAADHYHGRAAAPSGRGHQHPLGVTPRASPSAASGAGSSGALASSSSSRKSGITPTSSRAAAAQKRGPSLIITDALEGTVNSAGIGSDDDASDSLGNSLTNFPGRAASSKKHVTTFLRRKAAVLLTSKTAVASGMLGQQPTTRCKVTLGGFFRGSIQRLTIVAPPLQTVSWPLDEGCGSKVRREPITMDPTLARHPNHLLTMTTALTAAASIAHGGRLRTAPYDWQPTRLPASALNFNGASTFVTGHNIAHLFPPSTFSRFSIVMWVKESARGTSSGCIVTMHDINSPIVEASTGVYTHTRLDTRASPKKRYFVPFTTCFVLSDSSERSLALETEADIYDGLWHKLEWVVLDSSENRAAVIVDGKEVEARVVSHECPQDFRGSDLVLNVGARDEGDGGVSAHFHGEIRCLKLQGGDDEAVISWPLDEGEGCVAYDDCKRLVGRIVDPRWVLTTFPPLTPVFSPDSGMEFSPARDMCDEWRKAGVTINATIMSLTKRRGVVISLLSKSRRVVGAFVVNEGGDASAPVPEVGTHTLMLLRRTQRPIIDPSAASPETDPEQGMRSSVRASKVRSFRRLPTSEPSVTDSYDGLPPPGSSSPHERRATLPINAVVDVTPQQQQQQQQPYLRRAASRAYVKDIINASTAEDGWSSAAKRKPPTKLVDCLEEVIFQVHHDELCDGRWHHLRIDLLRDVENCTFAIDNIPIPMQMVSRRFMPDVAADGAAIDIMWESFIVGRAPDLPSFRGCLKGVSVYTLAGDPLLFVPLAGSTKFSSRVGRDVATSNMKWELAVPPPSCIYLANQGYVIVPPLRGFTFERFELSLSLRTPCLTAACIIEFGSRGQAYMALMLNQDAQGAFMPNTLHGVVSDSEGRELHAFCVCGVTISDNKWHRITWAVRNASGNEMAFIVDDTEQVVRFGECGSPSAFLPVDEGGSIGAVLEALNPKLCLQGLLQRVVVRSLEPGSDEVYARWDMNSGYGTVLTDSSGKRNHATAVKPIWRSEIRAPASFEVPNKARDLFTNAALSVSRWSNNPFDECVKSPVTGETMMESWPEEGWHSGAVGPQWVSLDLGAPCTVFAVEVTLHKASPSTHELWCSRTNISNSRLANSVAPPELKYIPAMSCVQSFSIKSTSSRTLRTDFRAPQFNVRWLRFMTTQSIVPVSVQRIRVMGLTGQWRMQRAYSIMRPLVDVSSSETTASLTPLTTSMNGTSRLQALEEIEVGPAVSPPKSAADKERELKQLFYTIDVDRTGFISTHAFMDVYKAADVIGTLSEERMYSELRDAGVYGAEMDYEQFRKILARIDRW